ncbi:hypothetical protein JXB22_07440 [candidate division WOR-3 bacterium]|nr:hypothetical protein [candidate division WOR-3 bacterium]
MCHEARIEYLREFYFYPEQYRDEGKRVRFVLATARVDTIRGLQEMKKLVREMPALSLDSRLRIAREYIFLGYPSYARDVLRLNDSTRMYGYTYLHEDNPIVASEYFSQLGDTVLVNDIDRYICLPRKSMRTATILSLVCPGAGEMYAGNAQLGIKDFLLNAGSIFLMYNALRQKKYVDAVLVFNFLFHRFYVGSLYNAQKTVLDSYEDQHDALMEYMHSTHFPDMELK